ncbi:hypothetical protein Z043_123997, partial [Scleropages formosus]
MDQREATRAWTNRSSSPFVVKQTSKPGSHPTASKELLMTVHTTTTTCLCTNGEGRIRCTSTPVTSQFLYPHSRCSPPSSSAAINIGGHPMELDLHLLPSSVPFPFISMFGQGLRIGFQGDLHTVHQKALITDPGGTTGNLTADKRTGLDAGVGLYPCIPWSDIEWSQWTQLQCTPSVNCFTCWGGMWSHTGGGGELLCVPLHLLLTMALG